MTYQDKVAAWNEFVKSKKMQRGYAQFPTLTYVKFGHEPAPLLFWGFWEITALLGINYGVGWGIAMHFLSWKQMNAPLWLQVGAAVFAGLSFGAVMAWMMKRQLKKYNLSTWEKFVAEIQNKMKSA
ncbi:DUF6404 family protein [Bdellovibrio svalbardensis]|uniref:DUF6404 family protein n=1 Tax=Bdellovibrio svalbardensis TaxID=2972972 RepID=A0ABT6DHH8_9BACT|nr:DUF6404 family protein [Bdellovibrio svalbardensis]MDG0816253.1 DUF6404 family protein [Bdellovibrio svalbardensis]